ncbi:MAG: hypothetical protein H6Q66_1988 [Firmicutes bacterium]|nr:hypothetical protein [Bacillota bacterium]
MLVTDCMAYQPLEIRLSNLQDTVNISLNNKQNGTCINCTLSVKQAARLTVGLLDLLKILGEPQDDMQKDAEVSITVSQPKPAQQSKEAA